MARLYGREGEVLAVGRAEGLVLVVGDSGIGKSRVLAAASQSAGERLVAPPMNLEAGPGTLQRAMLAQLASHIRLLETAGRRSTVRRDFRAAAKRVGAVSGKALVRVAADEILAVVRAKLGADIGKATLDFVRDVARSGDESLKRRLTTTAEPDVLDVLLKLITEVQKLAGRPLVMYWDQAERLSAADRALLADLPERLRGAGVTVVIGVNDALPEEQRLVRDVAVRGGTVIRIQSLTRPAMEEWLDAEGLPAEIWSTVFAASSGYPFFVRAAIDVYEAGGDLRALPENGAWRMLSHTRWMSLSTDTRVTAMRLAAFREEPPREFISVYLGRSSVEWAADRQMLLDAGTFIPSDGGGWFHDRQRAAIWTMEMDEAARADVARAGMSAVREHLRSSPGIPAWVITFAAELCATLSPDSMEQEDLRFLQCAIQLGDDELAALFALIELIDPATPDTAFVEIQIAASHAASVLDITGPGADAFERLHDAELIVQASNDQIAVAGLNNIPMDALAAIVGRISERLGRWPRPRLSATVFDLAIRPRLERFEAAMYSIGAGTPQLGARALQKASAPPTGLAISASIGVTPLFTAVSFETAEARDLAMRKLQGHQAQLPPDTVTVEEVFPLPGLRLRANRYGDIVRTLSEQNGTQLYSWSELQRLQTTIVDALRESMSPLERHVAGLSRPQGVLYASLGDAHVALRIAADEPRFEEITLPPMNVRSPLFELQLRKLQLLKPNERLRSTTHHYGRQQATLADALERATRPLHNAFREYNRLQPQLRLEVEDVPKHVLHFRELLRNDLANLDAAGVPGAGKYAPRRTLILVETVEIDIGPAWFALIHTFDAEVDSVELKVVSDIPRSDDFDHSAALGQFWGASVDGLLSTSLGYADSSLAEIMGYDPFADVRLNWSGTSSAARRET